MTYQVKYEEYRRYFLTFESEDDFKGWEDDGSSISDLLPSQINLSKCDIDVTEVEVAK